MNLPSGKFLRKTTSNIPQNTIVDAHDLHLTGDGGDKGTSRFVQKTNIKNSSFKFGTNFPFS